MRPHDDTSFFDSIWRRRIVWWCVAVGVTSIVAAAAPFLVFLIVLVIALWFTWLMDYIGAI